jgi:hypothetical protein
MASRTIPRNASRQIAAIRERELTCQVYCLRNDFHARDCDPQYAWDDLAQYRFARLSEHTDRDHHWVIQVHDNLWYELRAEPPA